MTGVGMDQDPKRDATLKLDTLDTEIKLREDSNRQLQFNPDDRILYPFGYTGAGKTTFILYCSNIELARIPDDSGVPKYGPKNTPTQEEEMKLLEHLEVGNKAGKSCTVYVSATQRNGFTFLDGPGFNDTGGPTKDVANAVALHSVMKRVPSLIPVLFIEHGQFSISRGQGIRDLIQGFCALFGNDTDLLAKHMVVVFTKVPEDVELLQIAQDIQDLQDLAAVGNTDEVLDILQSMENGCRGRKEMAKKILIFRPLDTKAQEDFIDLFKSHKCKPLKDPSTVFQVKLQPNTKTQLEAILSQLKQQIPIWLKDKETGKVVEQMRLLHKLSSTIPPVKDTLEFCSSNVDTCLVEKITDAKQVHFPLLLSENNNDVYLNRFLNTRNMLVIIKDLREFLGNVDFLETFDEWTKIQIKLFAEKIKKEKDFDKIRVGLKIMENLVKPEAFGYLENVDSFSSDLKVWVQSKVSELQEKVENGSTTLSKKNIETLLTDLQNLEQASVVQPYVSFDCAACLQKAVQTINKNMDQMLSRVVEYINSQPSPPISEEMISYFQTIKAICEYQPLAAFLALTTSQTEIEKPNQYQELKMRCREAASKVFDKLVLLSNSPNALKDTNEPVILQAKAMGEFDWEIKDCVEGELTKHIILFDNRVNEIMESLKKDVFYRSPGPDYERVPQLLQNLDSCKWLDKYTYGGNRIETKKSEALARLDQSLKSLVQRIEHGWKRSNYKDVQDYFKTLDNLDSAHLLPYLPSLQKHKEDASDFLQQQIRSKLDYGSKRLAAKPNAGSDLSSSHDITTPFTLPDAGYYWEVLVELSPLAQLVGSVDAEIKRLQNKIKQSLQSQGDEKIRKIQNNEYKFSEYGEWLDDFHRIEDRTEYPHLPQELRIYSRMKSCCLTEVEQLSKRVVSFCKSGELEQVPKMLEILEGASRLQFHIPNVTTIISETQSASAQVSKSIIDDVKEAFTAGKYYECLSSVQDIPEDQKLRKECIRFITHSLHNMVALIKSSISLIALKNDEKWKELLQTKMNFDQAQNTFKDILPDGPTFFRNAISGIYKAYDSKFSEELRSCKFDESAFSNESNQKEIIEIEKLMRSVSTNSLYLPDSTKAVESLKNGLEDAFSKLKTYIEDLKENYELVDTLYSSLPQGQKKITCLKNINKKISEYSKQACDPKTTAEEAQKGLELLKNLITNFNDSELKDFAYNEFITASQKIAEAEKRREKQFQKFLNQWDFNGIKECLAKYQDDATLTEAFKSTLKNEATKQIPQPLQLDASENDIDEFASQLTILMKIYTAFPWAISDSIIQSRKANIKDYFQNKSRGLGSYGPSEMGTSSFANNIRQTLTIKLLDHELGFRLIPEVDFAKTLDPCCQFFSKTQDDLESSMAQHNYSGLHKTLKLFETIDPLFQFLKSFFDKNQDYATGPLAITINRFSGHIRAMSQSRDWLHNTKLRLQGYWDKKEFRFMENALKNILNESYVPLVSLIPETATWLTEAKNDIITRYDTLADRTDKYLKTDKWKQFREDYDLLQRLSTVEVLLGKNCSVNTHQTIQDLILPNEKCSHNNNGLII